MKISLCVSIGTLSVRLTRNSVKSRKTLLIRDLKPALNENVGCEKTLSSLTYTGCSFFCSLLSNLLPIARYSFGLLKFCRIL